MSAFWISLVFVFIAEMGDKTQLVALAFSTRFKSSTVMLGVTVAAALTHLISVYVGEAAGRLLPLFWINLVAGIFFVAFGWWTLRAKDLGFADQPKHGLAPFLSVTSTFFLAEIGDKTMFATMALAAQQHDFLAVWLGSTIGMVLSSALAVLVGKYAGKKLPERLIKLAAACLFFCFGAASVVGAFAGGVRHL